MDRKEKKAIRMKILQLLDSPNPDHTEIERLGRLLGERDSYVPRARRRRKTEFLVDPEKYIEMRIAGKSVKEIAKYFGCSYEELKCEVNILMKREVIPKGAIPRGVGNLSNRMTKEEYLDKKAQGISDEAIAKELGLSKSVFTSKRKEWGIELKNNKKRNLITEQEYREMKYQLMTDYQIVKEKGMHHSTLLQYKRIWGVI